MNAVNPCTCTIMKELNVGLIGHQFMGKAHSNAYDNVASSLR